MSLVSLMPRMVGGTRDRSARHTRGFFAVELHDDVVHALRSARGEIPGGDLSVHPGPMSLGIGLDLEQLGVQLVAAARRIKDAPYQCTELAGLNKAAVSLASVAVEPLMKQIGSPTGAAVVITAMDSTASQVEGASIVTGRSMAGLWKVAKSTLPVLQGITLPRDGTPVAVPGLGSGTPVYVARTDALLGLAAGNTSDNTLDQLMSGATRTDDALLVAHYDEGFGNGDNEKKMLDGLRRFGFDAAAKRIEARLAAAVNARGEMAFRVSRHGLVATYSLGK
jgi:hypothetical protein